MEDMVTRETIGPVHWVRINRPEVLNAITRETADQIRSAFEQCEKDDARVIVLTGNGGSFCSGADLKAVEFGFTDPVTSATAVLLEAYHPLLRTIHRLPIPVIAAVDGVAAGIGCDLALACDIRLASDQAVFTEIFGKVGLTVDGGGSYTLARLIGAGRAMEMILTARKVSAAEALQWGLVSYVYPADRFAEDVQSYAENLAAKAPLALARSKQLLRESYEVASFEDALEKEGTIQKKLFGSEDFIEGVVAFLEKRPAQFKGR